MVSLPILEQISQSLSIHQTYYQLNTQDEHFSEKYHKGIINATKWLNELIYFYIQQENNFLLEFKENIQKQKEELSELKESEFKQGLFDELNIIEDTLNQKLK